MKKTAAIFLTTLFLFNMVGYRFVFNYAQQKSDQTFVAALDNDNYNDAELLTIKVPISLPYQNDRQNFERVDGEITYEGKIYKYVKRKIVNGELVLLCVPDHNKMRLQSAKDDFFKTANDLVQNNHSKKSDHSKSTSYKSLASDYINESQKNTDLLFSVILPVSISKEAAHLTSSPHLSPEQPPDFI